MNYMNKLSTSSVRQVLKTSHATCRRLRHTHGYQAMGSFHSENVDVLMALSDEEYQPPPLPFDDETTSRNAKNYRGFLLDPQWTFLNHGAFGAALGVGYERAEQWRFHLERQPLRYFDRDLLPHLVYSARRLANFCDSSNREAVTLIPNVTYGLNTVIRGYVEQQKEDAHILLWDTSYGSLKKMAAEYCKKVTEIPVSLHFDDKLCEMDDPSIIFEQVLQDYIEEHRIDTDNAMLILDHTTSNTAISMPIHSLARFGRERNMLVMVDGAHGLLTSPVKLDDSLPVDFYLSNGHKWLSCPRGVAMMYCPSEEFRESILRQPAVISHGIGQGYQSRFLWDGCRDYAAALSVPAVLDYWSEQGVEKVQKSNKEKLHAAVAILGQAWHGCHDDSVTLVPMSLHSPTMALVKLPDSFQKLPSTSDDAKRIQDMLYDNWIEVPIKCINGVLYVRISCHVYNELQEYDRLAQTILQNSPLL